MVCVVRYPAVTSFCLELKYVPANAYALLFPFEFSSNSNGFMPFVLQFLFFTHLSIALCALLSPVLSSSLAPGCQDAHHGIRKKSVLG